MNTKSFERSQKMGKFITYAALVFGSIIMIFPFVWMILTSSKTVSESIQIPPTILPQQFMLDNFVDAVNSLPFVNMYFNTIMMIIFRVIFAVVFSSMAGYAFAKLKFKGKNLLFGIVLMQMMLPSQIFIIPQYQMVAKLGLANSIAGLVFPGLVSAFGTFFLQIGRASCRERVSA